MKSEFIKNLIKERGLKGKGGRGYIHDLLRLEEYILNGPRGFASGMHYHILKGKYRREWEAIYRELKPKEFEEIMQREREEERKRKQEKERRRREEIIRQLKKEWLEKNAGTNLPPDAFGWEFVDCNEKPRGFIGAPEGRRKCPLCCEPVHDDWQYYIGYYYHKKCFKKAYQKFYGIKGCATVF